MNLIKFVSNYGVYIKKNEMKKIAFNIKHVTF